MYLPLYVIVSTYLCKYYCLFLFLDALGQGQWVLESGQVVEYAIVKLL